MKERKKKIGRKEGIAGDIIDGVVWSTTSSQDCIWATREKEKGSQEIKWTWKMLPSGVPAISNPPTHPPTYSVRKI